MFRYHHGYVAPLEHVQAYLGGVYSELYDERASDVVDANAELQHAREVVLQLQGHWRGATGGRSRPPRVGVLFRPGVPEGVLQERVLLLLSLLRVVRRKGRGGRGDVAYGGRRQLVLEHEHPGQRLAHETNPEMDEMFVFSTFLLEKFLLPLPAFLEDVVLAFRGLIRWEEKLDGRASVLGDVAANLVRVDLVHQKVVDLAGRMRAVCKKVKSVESKNPVGVHMRKEISAPVILTLMANSTLLSVLVGVTVM